MNAAAVAQLLTATTALVAAITALVRLFIHVRNHQGGNS